MVDVDLVCLHVDPADAVPNKQSEVDVAVTLGSDHCRELSRLGQRVLVDLLGPWVEDQDLVGAHLSEVYSLVGGDDKSQRQRAWCWNVVGSEFLGGVVKDGEGVSGRCRNIHAIFGSVQVVEGLEVSGDV